MDSVGQKIRELRKTSGLSQKDLASSLGITPPNLSQWESMAIPPLEGIMKICRHFDIPLWQFFMDDEAALKNYLPPWVRKEHLEFLKELNKLPESTQKKILKNITEIITLRKYI